MKSKLASLFNFFLYFLFLQSGFFFPAWVYKLSYSLASPNVRKQQENCHILRQIPLSEVQPRVRKSVSGL